MAADLYAALALPMRYAFSILMIVLLAGMACWLRAEDRRRRRRLDRLPEAGYIGEFIVEAGSEELPEGMLVLVPREGVLGFNRTCDAAVPVNGVAARHLDLLFEDGLGLLVRPRHGLTCAVDGQRLTHRCKPRLTPLLHGSRLTVGEAVLSLRVFEGVDIMHRATVQEEGFPDGAPTPGAIPEQPGGTVPPGTGPIPEMAPPVWQPVHPMPPDGQGVNGPRAQAYPNYANGPGTPYVPDGMPYAPMGVPHAPVTGDYDAYIPGAGQDAPQATPDEAGDPQAQTSAETSQEPEKQKPRRDKKAAKPPKLRPPRPNYSTEPDFAPDEDEPPVRQRRRGRRRSHG